MTTELALVFSIHSPPCWLEDLNSHIPGMSRVHSRFSEMCHFCWLKPKVHQVTPNQLLTQPVLTSSYSYVGTGPSPRRASQHCCQHHSHGNMETEAEKDWDMSSVTWEDPSRGGNWGRLPSSYLVPNLRPKLPYGLMLQSWFGWQALGRVQQ